MRRVGRSTVETRNVWDFASEVALVRWMARTRNVDHETYRRIQNEIDYIVRCALAGYRASGAYVTGECEHTGNASNLKRFFSVAVILLRLAKRLWGLARQGWTILDTQRRVLALLHLPRCCCSRAAAAARWYAQRPCMCCSFLDEARAHEDAVDRPRFSFQRICIHELRCARPPLPLVFDPQRCCAQLRVRRRCAAGAQRGVRHRVRTR